MRVVSGPRACIEKQLAALVEGWDHWGDGDRKDEAEQALARLAQGYREVISGHTVYLVTREPRY